MLLHSCCAPCSGEVIEAIRASAIDLTVYFYNPNIHPREEYDLRKVDQVAAVSALTGAGCDRLEEEIEQRLARDRQVATYRLGHDRGGDIAWLYQHGEVLERHDDEDGASLTVRLSADDRRRFETSRPVLQS